MPEPLDLGRRTRQLRNLVEPIAAAVFFVPEAHDAYIRLGFPPPQGAEDGIPLFDWGAYFVSRAACRYWFRLMSYATEQDFWTFWLEKVMILSRRHILFCRG